MSTDFSAIVVGDEVRARHRFTAEEVDAFARLSGDMNPMHVDAAFARTTRFKRPVVHGMLSAAHLWALIGRRLPGNGFLCLQQQVEFPVPLFVGDEVEFTLRVEHKSVATRTFIVRVEGRNEDNAIVLKGKATVLPIDSEASDPSSGGGAR